MSNKAAIKLANVELSEINVKVSYVITCFMCDKNLLLEAQTPNATFDEVVNFATSQGWHSYETDDETCGAACPECIKEVRENLTETTEGPTA
ncbi:MAG: hypothetical protein ACRCWP_02665 [Shewanella sp.]